MLQHRGTSRAGVLTGLLCALLTVGCATTGLQKGQTLVERGRYTEALEVYRQELERRPNNQELKVALNAAKKLEAERLCGMADGRLKADDPQRAFELFADATRYDPSSERAKAGLEASRDLWIKHGERQEQAGRPTEARAIYERILREFRGYAPCEAALKRIQLAGATKHRAAATAYLQANQPGNAVIELLKARRLYPDQPDLEGELLKAVQKLKDNATLDVAVFARAKSALVGPPWAAAFNERFRQNAIPMQVTAGPVERSVRVELFGTFSKPVKRSEKSQASMTLPAGFKSRPNPEYEALKVQVDAALARVRQAEQPVREAQRLLDSMVEERKRAGGVTPLPEEEVQRKRVAEVNKPYKAALDEFQRLSQQLAPIKPSFEEPLTRTVSYPVMMNYLTLELTGQVVITDAAGMVLETLPVLERLTVKDPSHPLLKATPDRPELPVDPVQLPSEAELKQKLEAGLMDKVGGRLEHFYRERLSKRWSEARRLAVAGKVDAAVEMFLLAWITEPRQAPDEVLRYVGETRQTLGLPLLETLRAPQSTSQASLHEGSNL